MKIRHAALILGGLSAATLSANAQLQGPDSSREPYVLPTDGLVKTISLVSGGDSIGAYRFGGVPDGLGANDNGDGTFSAFLHHELPLDRGVARRHGGTGAFISEWVITKPGHPDGPWHVLSGEDLIHTVHVWDVGSRLYSQSGAENFNRFCSADLARPNAYRHGSFGTSERIFMSGEESDGTFGGTYGRAFATIVTGPNKGTTYELPLMGNMAFENLVSCPTNQRITIMVPLDDSASSTTDSLGEVYFYIGTKTDEGNEIERAGLTNGELYALAIEGLPIEDAANGLGSGAGSTARFALAHLGDFSDDDGTGLYAETLANNPHGITKFLRPEDGHWDPTVPGMFYFITTGASYDSDNNGTRDTTGPGRVWRLTFDDIADPTAGGEVELIIDGTEGVVAPDNMTATRRGELFIQEDPGTNPLLARIWRWAPTARHEANVLVPLVEHNPRFFQDGGDFFLTINEETSGIIDLRGIVGEGWYLLDCQSHISLWREAEDAANRALFGYDLQTGIELVEDGQLLLMYARPMPRR